jgi:hypothetical protein
MIKYTMKKAAHIIMVNMTEQLTIDIYRLASTRQDKTTQH